MGIVLANTDKLRVSSAEHIKFNFIGMTNESSLT